MRRNIHVGLVSVGLLLGAAGCNEFLTGDKLSTDPNNPSRATIQTLLVGIQGGQFAFQEGTVPTMVCMWMQQCGATNGRYVEQAGRYVFGAGSNIGANGGDWAAIYTGGGLIDMDTIASMATKAGDSLYLGIDLVWKAFALGSATDLWGSIPYTQIRTSATPGLDSQLVLYDTVQAMLTVAIRKLNSGITTLPAPPDLVLGGDPTAWIKVANTLKARYFLHTVEAAATGKLGSRTVANVFTDVLAAASSGISDATGAGDFRAFHTGVGYPQSNAWFTFQDNSAFGGDLESGKALVDYMNGRHDPRRGDYFCPLASAAWKASHAYLLGNQIGDPNSNLQKVTTAGTSGASQPTWNTTLGGTTTDGGVTWTNQGPNYGGDDFNIPQASVSAFDCEPLRFSSTFRVPYVTYQENQLILAEANYALGNTLAAQGNLQAAYNAVPGLASTSTGVTGAALLDSIMMEKYVVTFQNIEALMDYRRTCIPNITPVTPNVLGILAVPGELFYPQTERNANSNIPSESQEVSAGVRTQSDVNPCTGPGAAAYP
jgi:SusD/RagB-like outer membrane lipoprotein